MRVLLVCAGMGVGGAERIAVTLAAHFRGQGAAVALAAPPGALDRELERLGVRRHHFPDRGRSRAGAALSALAVARAVRAARPDVVHAHNVKATALAWAGARLAGAGRVPVISTFHGVIPGEDRAAARVLRRADRIACVSDELARRMVTAGLPAARVSVLANAVEPAARPTAERLRALDHELRLPAGSPVVAAVGRLMPVKAHDRFLRAAALIAAQRADVRFLLVGDGPLRADLEALAQQLGLADGVRFTGTRLDARDLIARSALVVFTSESEGLSIAALEALDAGVPVIAPAVPGMRELLAPGAGVLLPDSEPASVATAALELLGAEERRRAMGSAGRDFVRGRYRPERMLSAYEELYAEAVTSARRIRRGR